MQILSADKLPALFDSVAARMDTVADELCEMDARMGDGDLGLTMRRGFAAVPEFLRETDEPDLGKKLVKAGMKMASIAPSTMGTLMASGIMGGGKALTGATQIVAAAYLAFLDAFCAGIAKLGKCQRHSGRHRTCSGRRCCGAESQSGSLARRCGGGRCPRRTRGRGGHQADGSKVRQGRRPPRGLRRCGRSGRYRGTVYA